MLFPELHLAICCADHWRGAPSHCTFPPGLRIVTVSAFSLCAGTRIRPGDVQQWLKHPSGQRAEPSTVKSALLQLFLQMFPPDSSALRQDGDVELSHDICCGLDQRNSSFDQPLTTSCFGSSTNASSCAIVLPIGHDAAHSCRHALGVARAH